jgi:hypothetical protein
LTAIKSATTLIDVSGKCWKKTGNNDELFNSDKDQLVRIETMLFLSDELMIISHLLNTYFIDEN